MATFPEYESFDGIGLANLVRRGIVSPDELLDAAIERLETCNPQLNAVIYKMYDQAQAAITDVLPAGAFQGVPFLLKDLLADYAGVPLSSGSRFTSGWIPKRDSELVKRFKQAGLVILGKTNTPEFGLSVVTEPTHFGATRNPWNLAYSPGGSSGGAAAAVAAGIVPMAHANDGAGSIRIPAAYCGLFGLKPSRGRTATGSTMMRMWENMVAEHVLTRSVRDSAAMLDVLSGLEVGSTQSLPKPETTFLQSLDHSFSRLQIAMTEQPFFPSTVNPEYGVALNKAAQLCHDMGHSVESVSLKINSADVALAYAMIMAGELAASIKRFSVAMGHKPKRHDLEQQTALLCHIGDHISAADFAWAGNVLDEATHHVAECFQDYDILMTPTLAAPPPLIGQLKSNWLEQGLLTLLTHIPSPSLLQKVVKQAAIRNFALCPFTPIYNISGQPAMSVPLYWDKQGLPIGIQFAGRYASEAMLLQLASQLEQASPWIERKPVAWIERSEIRVIK